MARRNLKSLNIVKSFNLGNIGRPMIVALTLLVFVIFTIIISAISLRYDFSYGKAYTLSSSTRNVLKNLDDIVTIKFYASSDLPTRLLPLKTEVVDLLNEYKKTGGSKVTVRVLDPKKDQKTAMEAQEAGVPELQFSQVERDKYAVTTAQFGIVLSYGDKKEVLPQVTEIESLEYNLTSSIYKMTNKELAKIAILGSSPGFDPQQDPMGSLKALLERQFVVEPIEVSTESATKGIDKSYNALIVLDNNQKEYTDDEIDAIRKYIKAKGKVLFFVDGVWVADSLQTSEAKHNLFSLLEEYGIKINKNLLLSTASEFVNFGNNQMQFMVPYPFWIKTDNFNDKVNYFSNINVLTFPWVSSVTLNKKAGVEIEELIKSTQRSWEQKENFTLNPQSIPEPQASNLKEFTIAASAKQKDGGQLVVIPTSRFVLDRFLSRSSANMELALNVLNEMASQGALSGIRQRAVLFYPVPDLPDSQKDLFKYANILFLPAVFALYGAYRLLRRR